MPMHSDVTPRKQPHFRVGAMRNYFAVLPTGIRPQYRLNNKASHAPGCFDRSGRPAQAGGILRGRFC